MANLKEVIHAHTPKGRYEQYRAKHDYLLEQTQGEARYLLEQRLDKDAKKFSTKKVAIEILGTAVLVTGGVIVGKELYNGTLMKDIKKAKDFFPNLTTEINRRYEAFLHRTGQSVADGMMASVIEQAPIALPLVGQAGDAAANAFIYNVADAMPKLVKLFVASIKASGLSLIFPGKK